MQEWTDVTSENYGVVVDELGNIYIQDEQILLHDTRSSKIYSFYFNSI